MRISEIIRESEEPRQNGKLKEVDVLKDINDAIKTAYDILKKDPEIIERNKDSENTKELDESIKGAISKTALAGMIALSGLSAQADQSLANGLAGCAGVMMGLGQSLMTTSPSSGQELYNKGMTALNLSSMNDQTGQAMQMFERFRNRTLNGGAKGVQDALSMLKGCHNFIDRATQQPQRSQATQQSQQPAQPQAAPKSTQQPQQSAPSVQPQQSKAAPASNNNRQSAQIQSNEIKTKRFPGGDVFTGKLQSNGEPGEGTYKFGDNGEVFIGKFDSKGDILTGTMKNAKGVVLYKLVNGEQVSDK